MLLHCVLRVKLLGLAEMMFFCCLCYEHQAKAEDCRAAFVHAQGSSIVILPPKWLKA